MFLNIQNTDLTGPDLGFCPELVFFYLNSPGSNYTLCLLDPDEYWQNHPELHDIPIYYASSLARKCMAVYQTYINAMNDKIRKAININNPFVFKHISNLKVSERTQSVLPPPAPLTNGSVFSEHGSL